MRLLISLVTYVAAIASANWLTATYGQVHVGFGYLVTAGTFSAGFALLARDFVQRLGGLRWSLLGIAGGCALSWVLADPFIATASAVAFLGAELVDLLVYTPLRRQSFMAAALVSNIVSAPVDTVIFLWVAGFPLTMSAVEGQFIGKVLWATIVPLAIYTLASAASRKAVNRDVSR